MFSIVAALVKPAYLSERKPGEIFFFALMTDLFLFRGNLMHTLLSIFTDSRMLLSMPLMFGAALQDGVMLIFNLLWGLLLTLTNAMTAG